MNDPLEWIAADLNALGEQGLTRSLRVLDRGLINFASNDYLGLAADPRLQTAAREAHEAFGAGASPLVSGWTEHHQALIEALARFEQTESAVLFPTGHAANLGTIAALVGKEDAVYLDRLNHACLIDGAKLSGARLRVYPHNDADKLDQILKRDKDRFRRRLIATDGVFSMDGDLAPLADLTMIAEANDAILMVDEAHGTGVYGPDGRGAASACQVADRVHVRVGTLSKALGSLGGFVAGSKRLCDWLIQSARPLIYSTALPLPVVAAARCALTIVEQEPWRRERVFRAARTLRTRLRIEPSEGGPILPLILGCSARTLKLSAWLREHGLLVPAIRPPTVPDGTARLRITVTASHTDQELDRLATLLLETAKPPT